MLLSHRIPVSVDPWRVIRAIEQQWSQQLGDWLEGGGANPAARLWTSAGSAVVEVDLPGCDPAAVQVSVLKDLLTVEVPPSAAGVPEQSEVHLRECRPLTGIELRLPFVVDPERTDAQYQHGVLRVTVHQRAADRPARIEVRR